MNQEKTAPKKEINIMTDKNGIPILGTSESATKKIEMLVQQNLMLKGALSEANGMIRAFSQKEANLVTLVILLLKDRENNRARFPLKEANDIGKKFVEAEVGLQTYVDKQTKDIVVYTQIIEKKEEEEKKEDSPIITP